MHDGAVLRGKILKEACTLYCIAREPVEPKNANAKHRLKQSIYCSSYSYNNKTRRFDRSSGCWVVECLRTLLLDEGTTRLHSSCITMDQVHATKLGVSQTIRTCIRCVFS